MATNENFGVRPCNTETLYRLDREQYLALSRQLGNPVPNESTTDIQAGYLLGVQHVLQKLREGFVVEDHNS